MTRFNSLFARLAWVLLATFLLLGLVLVAVSRQLDSGYEDEITQRLHYALAQHIAMEGPIFQGGEPDPAAVEKAFHNMMILGKGFEFYLLDPQGRLLNYSAPEEKIQRRQISMDAIQSYLSPNPTLPMRGPDPRSPDRDKIFSVAPLYENEALTGYLYIIINGEIYDSLAARVHQKHWWDLPALVVGLACLFGLLSSLGLLAWLTRPLRQLTGEIEGLQRQGFTGQLRLREHGPDETQRLSHAFNALSERLEQQYDRVRSVDEMRRELLAHVSHDLRTPLAALQGYLETWQLQHKQHGEADPRYITIAHQNAEKIHKMVDQLMELARLESDQVPMQIEPINIAELVQDVLQKYQPAAEAKQVLLDVQPKDPSLQVAADIEKLERVFTNLVDNALRHCQSGDTITVRLSARPEHLHVTVCDSGIGIPASDLPHIFDPHYKAANSVRGDSAHSGLGLAITRKLLSLHNSEIEVASQVQEGTEFRFNLSWA
ncbi:HAMP domain-containing sensor histidine kinase [Ferrimonas marina]|uniref:histidine kinase n=1 Tax=Ferrimonas marina TaxID=299255 RepID=A0A1M5S8E4_9GAMM|nr:HAMP domain-containing sensor histidine kinase [Ferrimonas marina]SHH34751.1 Signal transduction histidine kinase [Ferrimonas marina]